MDGKPDHSDEVVSRAQLRKKNQITLPPDVRDALRLSEGDEVEFTVHADGEVTLRGMTVIPTEQRWFWAEEWQTGEREASEEIAAGHTTVYDSAEEFLDHLNELDASI